MDLTHQDVEKVALLARLKLSTEELDQMTQQMDKIIHYVQQLSELNTDDIEPMAHTLDISNALADDEPHESYPREVMLSNSPNRDEECYRVPAVLGDG